MMAETSNTTSAKTGGINSTEAAMGNAAQALDARLSGPLAPLERALDDTLGQKASYQLPKDIKEMLVRFAPWLSLAGGVFGLFSAVGLWRAAHYVNQLADSVNRFTEAFGVSAPAQVSRLGLMFWLSLAAIVLFAVLAFLAFPGLKARKKVGWNLIFYSMLASVAYSFISLFYDGGGFGAFLGTLLGSAIGMYILFQVRSYYRI